MKQEKKKKEFSKTLLIQESLLIWIQTLAMLALAFICVFRGSYSELPWLAAMVAFPWTAYGVSQAFYYNKAKNENTAGGVVYERTLAEICSPAADEDEPVG